MRMGDIRQGAKSHQSRFENLLDSGFLSDLKITVQGVTFSVHKLIIATGSPVLYEEVKGVDFITVQDVLPKIYQLFLKFLYTGSCSLEVEDALPLLQLAEKNGVPDLVCKCRSLLKEDLTDDTAIPIYQQAIHYADETLRDKAQRYVCRNAWSIIETDEWTSLKLENLKRLLECEQLLVLNETQLIRALFRWGKAECERKNVAETKLSTILKDILKWISWDKIDPEQFEEPDVLELEKLFASYHSLQEGPKRKCKFSRKYFEDEGTSFVMSRLPQKFAYCTDNTTSEPEIIRFKTDVSICLLSIGIPAYSQSCGDFFSIQIEIRDVDNKCLMAISEKVPHSTEIYHCKFQKPLKINKNSWYTAIATITGTPGYGNTGGKSINYSKCLQPNGKETAVKFEFKSGSTSSVIDGISGGQIDELKFKLVED